LLSELSPIVLALQTNTTLTNVDLSGRNSSSRFAKMVTDLATGYEDAPPDGPEDRLKIAQMIAETLKINTTLLSVKLSRQFCTIRYDFCHSNIGVVLDLSGVFDNIAAALKVNKTLTSITLSSTFGCTLSSMSRVT
jgi:hypothetical protein